MMDCLQVHETGCKTEGLKVEWMVDLLVVGMVVEREQRMVASMAESSADV
jgi:hypothetical protein